MNQAKHAVDNALVRGLLLSQAPQWSPLRIEHIVNGGWCNITFRLGNDMVVRLPREAGNAQRIVTECAWLPKLAAHLPTAIPQPVFQGEASEAFPFLISTIPQRSAVS